MLAALLAATLAQAPVDYRRPESWLCRPGRHDACAVDVAVTTVAADGRMQREPARPAGNPKADCFYVYPTASMDATPNSDMVAGREEQGMVAAQFAAFAAVCRPYAPLYRQVTLTALRSLMQGKASDADWDLAYGDVQAAWRDYLAHDNHGRPFALIGHSQGSMMLKRLVAEDIDGKPIQRQLLSAMLPGTAVLVPAGKDIGGDFQALPLCRADTQTGCIISWASFRDTAPPTAKSLFGRSAKPGYEAACTNPAALAGGPASLDAIMGFPWWQGGVAQFKPPARWAAAGTPLATRFVRMPGLLSAQCRSAGGANYLAVTVTPGAAADLADSVAGADAIGDTAWPDWGWHVVDVQITQGDQLRLVARQARAWRAR